MKRSRRRGGAERGTPTARTAGSTVGVRSDRTPQPRTRIDRPVCDLCGLTEDGIKIVEGTA